MAQKIFHFSSVLMLNPDYAPASRQTGE